MASSLLSQPFFPLNLAFSTKKKKKKNFQAADSMLRESRSRHFEYEYEPLSSLGSGGAATVARCVHRASGAVVAAKRIPLTSSSSSSTSAASARQAALVELAALILLQGAPHAIELLDAIEEKAEKAEREGEGSSAAQNCVFIVTRLCAGGELFDAVVSKEHYCEREAALVVRSLASYLAAAHRVGVVHRDLKPENVMLLAANSSSESPSGDSSSPARAAVWPAPPRTALPLPPPPPPPPSSSAASASTAPNAASAPAPSLQRLPSRLCREASDVAAMLSSCPPALPFPPPPRSSFSGEIIARRRTTTTATTKTTTTGAGNKNAFFAEDDAPVAAAADRAPPAASSSSSSSSNSSSSSIEGRRRCSCLEREGIRVIDLGCAALFDPSGYFPSAAADASSTLTSNSTSTTLPTSSSSKGQALKKMVGTPYYAAPEVLPNSPFPLRGAASDVWSLGVIAFVLLSGRPPFGGRDDAEVVRRVAVGRFSFRGETWGEVSDAAKAAISSMLEKDPSKRATASQVLESEWLSSSSSEKKTATARGGGGGRGAVAAADAAASSSSSSFSSSNRLRARIRAFAAESKLHAVAALALTRTISGAEGAAQLREMILLQEGLSESEEEEVESDSDDGNDHDEESVAVPRLAGGGAAVAPSRREGRAASHRCSAPGGLAVENEKTRGALGTPKVGGGSKSGGGGSKTLGGLLRRTLTLGASSSPAALAAAAAALPPGCRECKTCGGIVVEEEEGDEEGKKGGREREGGAAAEAFLEGLLERGGCGGGDEKPQALAPPPSSTLLRTQTTVGPERAAELAFAALDADGDGWLSVDDLLRAGGGADAGGGEAKEKEEKNGGRSGTLLLMTREDALACIAEARKFTGSSSPRQHGDGEREAEEERMDFEGFKRVLLQAPAKKKAAA